MILPRPFLLSGDLSDLSKSGKSVISKQPPFRCLMLCLLLLATHPIALKAATPTAISPSEYQIRLKSLDQLVASCQHAMTPANCQSEQVGPDLQLALPAGTRSIRFAWLRRLLNLASERQARTDQAAKENAPKAQTAKSASGPAECQPEFQPVTLAQQLEDGRKRLAEDLEVAAQATTQALAQVASQHSGKSPANPTADPSPQRQALIRILAAREYHAAVVGPSLIDRLLEKVGNWIDRAIGKLQQAGFQSRWVGLTAEVGFILLLCIAVVWFLIRLERQGRLGLVRTYTGPSSGAVSARDWQLWLEDAHNAAARGAWRDAIHLLYWASISRLESGGLWPADRARTPREYLALLSQENSQHPDLVTLTKSFERTWYAGRPAAEADYHQAEQMAGKLGAR